MKQIITTISLIAMLALPQHAEASDSQDGQGQLAAPRGGANEEFSRFEVVAVCSGVTSRWITPFEHAAVTVSTNNVGRSQYPEYLFSIVSPTQDVYRPIIVHYHYCGPLKFSHPNDPWFVPGRLYSLWLTRKEYDRGVLRMCPSTSRRGKRRIAETIPSPYALAELEKKRDKFKSFYLKAVEYDRPHLEPYKERLERTKRLKTAEAAAVDRVEKKRRTRRRTESE